MKLAGKVAIVTGSSRGIGKAIALEMAREGADIVVVARTDVEGGRFPGSIHQTAEEIRALGRRCLPVKTDLTKDSDIENMVSQAYEEFGEVDILVNNAAVNFIGSILETTTKRWDLLMGINVRGDFLCTKAVLPRMMERKRGNIINFSSLAGFGQELENVSVLYCVTKAGVNMFTTALAEELRKHNIAVNAFVPHWVATETVRMMYPQEDPSHMESPRTWAKYAVLVACQDAQSLSGRLLTMEELKKLFGEV